ncbi:hypothetical protein N9Y42_02405 [Mariniblastus sp.]|nr:hypothetical protein [Mariniblastus sp.]
MPNQVTRFRVGDRVQVAHAEHILSTLDSNCRFEGLPFMPQMVSFCGQELTVTRWVNNVCYPVQGGADFGNLTNSVLLNVDRCDGSSFGGCQMACPLIWKTEWLTSNTSQNETTDGLNAPEAVKQLNDFAAANAMNSGLVTCQATQLHQITHRRNRLNVEQYVDEVNLNRVSATALATSFCGGMLGRVTGSKRPIVGTLKRTPISDLQLVPGDAVTVKSQSDIIKTLDTNGKNRGLWFDPVMLRYCRQKLKVTERITTLVDETSGQIRQLKVPSVVLEDLQCDPTARRFCSRLLHLFWREAWLERA